MKSPGEIAASPTEGERYPLDDRDLSHDESTAFRMRLQAIDALDAFNPSAPTYWSEDAIRLRTAQDDQDQMAFSPESNPGPLTGDTAEPVRWLGKHIHHNWGGHLSRAAYELGVLPGVLHRALKTGSFDPQAFATPSTGGDPRAQDLTLNFTPPVEGQLTPLSRIKPGGGVAFGRHLWWKHVLDIATFLPTDGLRQAWLRTMQSMFLGWFFDAKVAAMVAGPGPSKDSRPFW